MTERARSPLYQLRTLREWRVMAGLNGSQLAKLADIDTKTMSSAQRIGYRTNEIIAHRIVEVLDKVLHDKGKLPPEHHLEVQDVKGMEVYDPSIHRGAREQESIEQ